MHDEPSLPKLSIVTPSYNQGGFLETTMLSVLEQSYPRFEYIVIDGGSTDESVEIIRRYQDRVAYWVTEKDGGQAHAINKGLKRATGEIFAFINSDDLYLPGALRAVGEYFRRHPTCTWLCGDTILFGPGRAPEHPRTRVPKSAAHALSWAYRAPQPGMFWRREIVADGFQEKWRYCFDNELYVRLLLRGHRCEHLPVAVAAYRLHPTSKTVAEAAGFDREFDEIAEIYHPHLAGSARRWTLGTLLLRRSLQASAAGDARAAARYLLRSFVVHPPGIAGRLFWGSLWQALRTVRLTKRNGLGD